MVVDTIKDYAIQLYCSSRHINNQTSFSFWPFHHMGAVYHKWHSCCYSDSMSHSIHLLSPGQMATDLGSGDS